MSRRLSHEEIDNTLRDLLQDDASAASQFLSEPEFTPFDNNYTLQNPSQTLIESLEVMATDVADRLIADPTRMAAVLPCTPSGATDTACFRQFVEEFGARALRRPLSQAEVDAYMALQDFSTESNQFVDNDFNTGVGLVIQAVVQDPEFLYRLEVGMPTTEDGIFKLTDYEIAAKMSYLLTGTTPDDQLLADAEAGLLSEPEDRLAAAARLVDSDGAKDLMHRYHSMWLGYRAVPGTPELLTGWSNESAALIDRVVFDERLPYSSILTMEETYVDAALATHYGLPAPGGGEGWVSYEGSGRAGILGHGSVLAAFSKFNDTSPTQRGIFIRERLMCSVIPPPPPEVDVDNEPNDPANPDACKEERYLAHLNMGPSCAGCHALFDPIGLGLENYNVQGVYRETDDDNPACTISGNGTVEGVGDFNGPAELSQLLAGAGVIESCALEHYLAFAYGRELTEAESAHVDAYAQIFADANYDFAGTVEAFVGHDVFGFKREPGA